MTDQEKTDAHLRECDTGIEKERTTHEGSLRAFDQYLTALAAAAVSLAFGYYTTSYKEVPLNQRWQLFIPILFFLISLLVVIGSQITSARMSSWKIKELRHWKTAGEEDAQRKARAKRDLWCTVTEWMNHVAITALVIGLFTFTFIVYYQTKDTPQETKSPNKNNELMTEEDKDNKPKPMQPTQRPERGDDGRGGRLNEGVTDGDKGWPPAKSEPTKEQPKKEGK